MEDKLIEKYLAACKLAQMSPTRIAIIEAVLKGFAEYCEKQGKGKKETERMRSAFLLDGRGRV